MKPPNPYSIALLAGRAALAAQWFATLGFTMPYGVNVADFILDVASGARLCSYPLCADAHAFAGLKVQVSCYLLPLTVRLQSYEF